MVNLDYSDCTKTSQSFGCSLLYLSYTNENNCDFAVNKTLVIMPYNFNVCDNIYRGNLVTGKLYGYWGYFKLLKTIS